MPDVFRTAGLIANGIHYTDLSIKEGLATFITGPSGVGKSTLLKLFNGTRSPSSGEIYYRETNIADLDTIALRKKVILTGQDLYLFDGTILENFHRFYGYREESAPSTEILEHFLSLCCLNCSITSNTSTMSGGEKQRIYLALFLSFMPDVLLLDEPTSALDVRNSNDIFENIFGFCRTNKITVIVVSHDLSLAEKFSEACIDLGQLAKKEVSGHEWHY